MKRALVLCGGGSLGSYEVGVWKFLREKGMQFDIVTGTSIGSINGAMVTTGDYDKAERLWQNIAADKVMVNGMNFYNGLLKKINAQVNRSFLAFAKTYITHGGADISPLVQLVQSTIDPERIKASPIQLGVVTTAYPTLKEVDVVANTLPTDHILPYLHASSACYPIFPVYKIDGKSFIDGGYNNNLPIDFALRMGADEIVAVLLHAVPKMPQHPELMDLPFVTTVRPSHDTGSIMDFYGVTATNNMTLGYQDARKCFGAAWGRSFTFEIDDSLLPLAEEFSLALALKHPYQFRKITKALSYEGIEPRTPRQILLRSLEFLGEWLELDYLQTYTYVGFIKLCLRTIDSNGKKEAAMAFAKNHNWGRLLTKNERPGFLLYLYYLSSNNLKSPKLDALFALSPETAALRELFILLQSKGLLSKV